MEARTPVDLTVCGASAPLPSSDHEIYRHFDPVKDVVGAPEKYDQGFMQRLISRLYALEETVRAQKAELQKCNQKIAALTGREN